MILTDTIFCVKNKVRSAKYEEVKIMKNLFKIMCVLLAVMIGASVSITVNAETVAEVVTQATATSKDINTSKISTNSVTFGYSVTLTAMSKGLDTKKCKYAFFYKYEDESWTTIQGYSTQTEVNWKPEKIGQYEVCIKILCDSKVYKKYFNILVSEELVNLSLVSSSHIKTGDAVTLNARASGGLPGYTFAYYCKRAYSDWWTILNDYKEATSVQWKPSESGEYDICIKVKDSFDQISEKYFTLTVENEGVKIPSEFYIDLKAPVSAPYQWSFDISDNEVIQFSEKEEYRSMSVLDSSVTLRYYFKAVKTGESEINMKYESYSGKVYNISYKITVDRHLNYTVEDSNGTYFSGDIPEIKQVKRPFEVNMELAPKGYSWKCDISNSNVIELSGTEKVYRQTFTFNALRKGFATITLSCSSPSDTNIIYQLIYNVSIDDDMNINVDSYDGCYIPDYWLPKIELL